MKAEYRTFFKYNISFKVNLFDHFIIQVIGPLPFFIEIIQNIPWLGNNISVQFHDETSFTKNINDDCQVDHEVMQIATREDLWQFQSFNILVIQIKFNVKLKISELLGPKIRDVMVEQGKKVFLWNCIVFLIKIPLNNLELDLMTNHKD